MNIQDRITSLKQSEKLKELGINQSVEVGDWFFDVWEKKLCFRYNSTSASQYENKHDQGVRVVIEETQGAVHVKAFDGAQIDAMLPTRLEDKDITFYFNIAKGSDYFNSSFYDESSNSNFKRIDAAGKTKLEAKTNLLIQLLEQGFIQPQ